MAYVLKLESLRVRGDFDSWWRDAANLRSLFEALGKHGLDIGVARIEDAQDRSTPIAGDPDSIANYLTGAPRDLFLLHGMHGAHLIVQGEAKRLELALTLPADHPLLMHGAMARLKDCVAALYDNWSDALSFDGPLALRRVSLPYPRPRPMRLASGWPLDALIDWVAPLDRAQPGRDEIAEGLLHDPLPANAQREVRRNALSVVQWVHSFPNASVEAQALSDREAWLTRRFEFPIAPGFNGHGDKRVKPPTRNQHEALTYYNKGNHHGFKALRADASGVLDESILAQLITALESGKLADGEPLKRLDAILPSREIALLCTQNLQSKGIDRVLYADESGRLWNPSPPGLWR